MTKFELEFSDIFELLREAVDGEYNLQEEYPMEFDRVVRYYQKHGYDLYFDDQITEEELYNNVIELLQETLEGDL